MVLITTKKGAEGRIKVEYSGSTTLKTLGLMQEAMSLDQWADGVMTAIEMMIKRHIAFTPMQSWLRNTKVHLLI